MTYTGGIVQARMSSRRFPGKSLYRVKGKPMLAYLLDRLERCASLNRVVVATSRDESDNPIVDFCGGRGVDCYRGPLEDVAGRFRETLRAYGFDVLVRINGDSPLLDPGLIEKGVCIFLENDVDLVTNTVPRTFPKGQSVEVVRGTTFLSAYPRMHKEDEKEHVTLFFYRRREEFRILNFESKEDYGNIQLSVDSPDDMDTFASIVSRMRKPHWEYTLDEILQLHREGRVQKCSEKGQRCDGNG